MTEFFCFPSFSMISVARKCLLYKCSSLKWVLFCSKFLTFYDLACQARRSFCKPITRPISLQAINRKQKTTTGSDPEKPIPSRLKYISTSTEIRFLRPEINFKINGNKISSTLRAHRNIFQNLFQVTEILFLTVRGSLI